MVNENYSLFIELVSLVEEAILLNKGKSFSYKSSPIYIGVDIDINSVNTTFTNHLESLGNYEGIIAYSIIEDFSIPIRNIILEIIYRGEGDYYD